MKDIAIILFNNYYFYQDAGWHPLLSSFLNFNRAFFTVICEICSIFIYMFLGKEEIMRVRTNEYLSEFITNQFDIAKFRLLINTYLEIIYTFDAMLNDEYYKIKFTSDGDIKIGGNKRPNNKQMESMLLRDFTTKEKMQEVLLQYKLAFNHLNDLEREIFKLTFIEKAKDLDVCDELCIYQKKLIQVRNSAMVRFCLYLGLDRFIDLF